MRYGRNDLPTVIATSVVRSTHKGESHGGIYLIDLRNGDQQQVRNWDDPNISWAGRGDERGLRGIAFHERSVLIAASDRIVILDQELNVVDSFVNPYLKHCHEIYRAGNTLWLSSTGFDCVLGFELSTGRFSIGYHLTRSYPSRVARKLERSPRYSVRTFDPQASAEPSLTDRLHVNNVWPHEDSILVSGTGLRHIVEIRDDSTGRYARVPRGTHNAHPFRDGILVNHTRSNRIAFMTRRGRVRKSFPIKVYPESKLTHASLPADHARQAFGRGLCTWSDRVVIGGSSPATVSAFDFDTEQLLARVSVTMDVRNAIHGLEVWPF